MSTIDDSTRGILDPLAPVRRSMLTRVPAADDLAYFVDYFWSVEWDVDEPVVRETIPFPSVHLVIRRGESGVSGLVRRRFTTTLEGRGTVFAVKFRPGAFYPFLGEPVSTLTDRVRSLEEVFGGAGPALEREVEGCADMECRIALASAFLRDRLPPRDPMVQTVATMVDRIAADRSITRVDHLAERVGSSVRSLQRIFDRYVGASPKWVIQRYRLQEAAERLAREGAGDLTGLAYSLGYADQAHFIRDFKSLIGATPAAYARRASHRSDDSAPQST
jgi:AraC-like DNA-binding protein